MPDIPRERCELIAESLAAINEYMAVIHSESDFVGSAEGRLRLNAIALRVQAIGENVKQIAAIDPTFFEEDLPFDVDNIIRFRDFISHHYEKSITRLFMKSVPNS